MANPSNARSTKSGRVYQWGKEEFDSVTTILNGGVPKPALTNWASKSAAQFAVDKSELWLPLAKEDKQAAVDLIKGAPWRDRDAAANKGTMVHDYAEAQVTGLPMEEPPKEIVGHIQSLLKWWSDWGITPDDYTRTEATVYNRTFGYAGTFDFMMGSVLGDYKTNRSGIFPETALQLAAYANAEFIGLPDGTEEPMPEITECWGVHLAPRSYKIIPLRTDADVFEVFLSAMNIHKWTGGKGNDAVGSPLAPPKQEVVA